MMRLIGNVMMGLGIVMLLWGYDEYESTGSRVKKALSGSTSDRAIALLVGGGACAVAGFYLTFIKKKK